MDKEQLERMYHNGYDCLLDFDNTLVFELNWRGYAIISDRNVKKFKNKFELFMYFSENMEEVDFSKEPKRTKIEDLINIEPGELNPLKFKEDLTDYLTI